MSQIDDLSETFRQMNDDILVSSALHLSDYLPEAQSVLLKEIASRPGCDEKLRRARSEVKDGEQKRKEDDHAKRQRFPGFVIGVAGISMFLYILLSLFENMEVLDIIWNLLWLLLSAAVFLSFFDSTMRPVHGSRLFKSTGAACLLALLAFLVTGKTTFVFGGFVGFAVFAVFGWVGSKFVPRSFYSNPKFLLALGRFWPELNEDPRNKKSLGEQASDYTCSECHTLVSPDAAICPKCGATFT